MNNQFLNDFFQRREINARKAVEPNPTKGKGGLKTVGPGPATGTISLAHILEKKPPAKVVLEYLKEKINRDCQ
jgi:hypothetical protein